jgi:putative proteasome-type protease
LENDSEHKLFLLYPQGNWVEVVRGTPYYIIGESAYGKPLLDRALTYESSMELAVKIGCLAFDATRTSATDVDFPLDIVLYRRGTYHVIERRYDRDGLAVLSQWWQERMIESVEQAPADWIGEFVAQLPNGPQETDDAAHST